MLLLQLVINLRLLMKPFTFPLYYVFKIQCVFYHRQPISSWTATATVLRRHVWLVAIELASHRAGDIQPGNQPEGTLDLSKPLPAP